MPGRIMVDIAPLRESRAFRLLFLAGLITTLGSQLTVVAVPFQVYDLTRSSFQVGLVSLAQLVPLIVGSLIGGSVGDAVDRRKILAFTGILLGFTSAALALNSLGGHPLLWVLYVVPALAAGLNGFSGPARIAAIPLLLPARHLVAAYSFSQMVFQVGAVVGPAVAGVLISSVGVPWVYGIDACTFAFTVPLYVAMGPLPPTPGTRRPGVGSIMEGLRYIRGRQAIQGVFLVDINAMVFGMPRALFPALSTSVFHGGATTLGYLYAAPGAGALIGAATTGWVTHLRRRGLAVVVAVVVWGAAITVFGFSHVLWVALCLLAVAGWADVISAVLRNTILQTEAPDEFRSRLSSVQLAVVQGGPRLGDLESGSVADLVSTEFAIVSGGLACIAGAIALAALLPGFRHNRASPGPGAESVAQDT